MDRRYYNFRSDLQLEGDTLLVEISVTYLVAEREMQITSVVAIDTRINIPVSLDIEKQFAHLLNQCIQIYSEEQFERNDNGKER